MNSQNHATQSNITTLKHLKNDELLSQMKTLVKSERKITLDILLHLKEVERRRLFAIRGYSSLYEFVTKELGYSEGAAMRRIDSMRLLKEVPELEAKVLDGSVNLTTLAKTKSVLRAQEKVSGVKVSIEQTLEAVQMVENKSGVETAKTLFELFPEAAKVVEQTKVTVINESTTRVSVSLDQETMDLLEKAKALLSHSVPDQDLAKVLKHVLKTFIGRRDPLKTKSDLLGVSGSAPPALHTGLAAAVAKRQCVEKRGPSGVPKARAYISMKLKKEVWQKSQGQCAYVDPLTKRKCEAKHFLEIDHIKPIAVGGENEPENLRLLCRTHNQLRARPVWSAGGA